MIGLADLRLGTPNDSQQPIHPKEPQKLPITHSPELPHTWTSVGVRRRPAVACAARTTAPAVGVFALPLLPALLDLPLDDAP